jgi:hypothetical protein
MTPGMTHKDALVVFLRGCGDRGIRQSGGRHPRPVSVPRFSLLRIHQAGEGGRGRWNRIRRRCPPTMKGNSPKRNPQRREWPNNPRRKKLRSILGGMRSEREEPAHLSSQAREELLTAQTSRRPGRRLPSLEACPRDVDSELCSSKKRQCFKDILCDLYAPTFDYAPSCGGDWSRGAKDCFDLWGLFQIL